MDEMQTQSEPADVNRLVDLAISPGAIELPGANRYTITLTPSWTSNLNGNASVRAKLKVLNRQNGRCGRDLRTER